MKNRRIPVVLQMNWVECGAACLAMILSHFGRKTRLEECRAKCDPGRNGLTARTILAAAREFGLRARAYSIASQDLGGVPLPCVAYWTDNHFVVLERWSRSCIEIVDPACGRRQLSASEFQESFSGVVLSFEPAPEFERRAVRRPNLLWNYFKAFLRSPQARGTLTQILGASILLQMFGFALPLLTKELVDRVIPLRNMDELNVLALGALAIALMNAAISYPRSLLLLRLGARLDSALMLGFFKHLLSLPYRFFQQRSSGDLMMRLTSNITIREALASYTTSTILDGALVLIFLIALWKI
jgi:ATP-binding cassette subfamily B protein